MTARTLRNADVCASPADFLLGLRVPPLIALNVTVAVLPARAPEITKWTE